MLVKDDVVDAVKESPLFEKWGEKGDIDEIINRLKVYIDPFSLQ
jgi:hypothetical protein